MGGGDNSIQNEGKSGSVYEGRIDELTGSRISGWAWDKSSPNASITLSVRSTRGEVVNVLANIYREDLANLGYGEGRHGFHVDISTWELSGAEIDVSVYGAPSEILFPSLTVSTASSLMSKDWAEQFGLLLLQEHNQIEYLWLSTNEAP